jgi:hypothetical protein
MPPPPRSAREEQRSLNVRTLVIASAASATAALVTSRLWIAGTWVAAAMTPVIVALVSELLHRPADRLTRGLTTEREALPDPEAPARRVAERLRADAPPPDPDAPRTVPSRAEPPVHIYRSHAGPGAQSRPAPGRRRQIAFRAVLVTAALAFAIGGVALTVSELIAGSSFGKSDRRTTLIPATRHKNSTKSDGNETRTTPEQTDTEQQTTPSETTPQTDTGTDTTTTPTPSGEPAPTDTTGTTPTTTTQP